MHFSKRTSWNVEESELARAHRERLEAGLPIADLTASNPTRCCFSYPAELLTALTDPQSLDYDPQPLGMLPARQAVCGYYATHGIKVKPEQITLTTSTSEAYSYLFRLLCDASDEVISLRPGYPLFDFLAGLDDVMLCAAPLVYDEGWQIEFEGLERAVTERTRAIVVVHPNNPTGHFTERWEKDRLADLCRRHGLALIVDEVFLDYGLGPEERQSSFAAGLEGIPVFVVSGLSKIAGLPQMKAAWIVATGPETPAAMARLEVIADTFLSMNAPVQLALPKWLEASPGIQHQILTRVQTNLTALDRELDRASRLNRLKVEGGWYAVLRIPALEPDDSTVLKLLERGVWVHPGHFFGMGPSGWLVVSLLAIEPEFGAGVTKLIDYFRTHQVSNNSGDQL
jgi:alanine-synthesizing transaminase